MVLLLQKFCTLKNYLYFLIIKYYNMNLYLKGYFGFAKRKILYNKLFSLLYWNNLLYNYVKELNYGWLTALTLSGLGYKATRKIFILKKKYWRINVGHSHIFQYLPPKNIIFKIKNRNLLLFGSKKRQIFDIIQIIQKFHKPDIYKGIGIRYPYETLKLKKGKVRQ